MLTGVGLPHNLLICIMIKDIKAREILDSRGNPTVEVSLYLEEGVFVSSVPSGASTGMHEAKELRDGGERYGGKGVLKAVGNIEKKIKPLLVGQKIDPLEIDKILINADGTENKSNLGANAILGVSMCAFRAGAFIEKKTLYDYLSSKYSFKKEMPVPCFNVINGGSHSGGGVSFQEFMIVPESNLFSDNLRFAVEFSKKLKRIILDEYGPESINIGDEGGFVPYIKKEEDVLRLLNKVNSNTNVLIDVAATEFFENGEYLLKEGKKTKEEMINFYKKLSEDFPILGFEDPLEENDFLGWSELKKSLEGLIIVGDDLLVTNTKRIKEAKDNDSCNAMILKINQIGSISEAIEAAKMAKEMGWKIIVSHRSGETNDDFIADFAVGIGADFIKSGAPQRGERVAKYNKILKIEREILKIN